MAAAKQNLGKIPCPACGDPVAVHRAETGTLSIKCQHSDCELSAFAQKHTGRARAWLAALPQREPEPAPSAAPAPVVVPTAKPAPKAPPKAAFTLGGL